MGAAAGTVTGEALTRQAVFAQRPDPRILGSALKLASHPRGASDLIEELGQDNNFQLEVVGGSGSRIAPAAVFPDASHAEHVAQ
jgi:hypothetical protein